MENSKIREKFDFLFIIPMEEEFDTFTELIKFKYSKDFGSEIFYFLDLPNSNYNGIAVINFRKGISRALDVTRKALNLFDIRMVINMGIAGGLNDVLKLGDIVIPETVIHYQADSKARPKDKLDHSYKIEHSPKYYNTNHSLITCIQNFKYHELNLFKEFQENCSAFQVDLDLNEKLKRFINIKPKYYVGKHASGDTVSASKAFIDEIKAVDRNIISIDMESAGIYYVTSEFTKPIPTLMIRGITDLADDKKKDFDKIQGGIFRRYAMWNVVKFFLTLISAISFQKRFSEIGLLRFPKELKLNESQKEIRDILSQEPYRSKDPRRKYP
ncbi:hypothetical protein LCGC14_0733610 [marine sediment metagenome]|uniref:Nucleoside phosphorylase domain-containing protein n=1 Tax=marine sediment metagenome TaxID=412755 RepID=A0A0F9QTR9_9ZZZZ